MRKLLWLLLVSALICMAPPAWAQAVQVTVNGEPVYLDQPAIMQGGRVLVPVRGIFEKLGATVLYDAPTRTVKAVRQPDVVVMLPLGSTVATINGQNHFLDVPAMAIGGRTVVPLRFVSEAMGADVRWNAASRLVAITSAAPPQVQTPPPPVAQPPPPMAPPPAPPPAWQPVITSVVTDRSGPIGTGETFHVRMYGQPGGIATFDVGWNVENPMREGPAGVYNGLYTVTMEDNEPNATVVAHLYLPDGRQGALNAPLPVSLLGGRTGGPHRHQYLGDVQLSAPTLYAGDVLGLSVVAPPGAVLVAAIGDQVVPMIEGPPGTYRCTYRPPPDYFASAPVVVRMRTRTGQEERAVAPRRVLFLGNQVPRGQLISSAGALGTALPGQPVQIQMVGAPGGVATYDIGGQRNLPMNEVSRGHYSATYRVPAGAAPATVPIVTRLRFSDGRVAEHRAQRPLVVTAAPHPVQPPVAPRPAVPRPRHTPTPTPSPRFAPPPVSHQTPPPVAQPAPRPAAPPPPPPRRTPTPTPSPRFAPPPVSHQTPPPVQTPAPSPAIAPPRHTPRAVPAVIRNVAYNSGVLHAGVVFTITVEGTPSARVHATVGRRRMVLREEQPGVYRGTFTVNAGEREENVRVHVILRSPNGRAAQADGKAPISIDGTRPPGPRR